MPSHGKITHTDAHPTKTTDAEAISAITIHDWVNVQTSLRKSPGGMPIACRK